MPNHTTCILTCTSSDKDISKLLKKHISIKDREDSSKYLDFNKIVPMPKGIAETCYHDTIFEITKTKTDAEIQELEDNRKILEEHNQKEHGYRNWYDWSVDNWDTKWNSYDCLISSEFVSFYTAWSPPLKVIKELAKITGESFRLAYLDEGRMFCGVYQVAPDGSENDECYKDCENVPFWLQEELSMYDYDEDGEMVFWSDGSRYDEDGNILTLEEAEARNSTKEAS
jgi:hypothetical protein